MDNPRAESGYRPKPTQGEDGEWTTALTGQEVKEQSAADYARVFAKGAFQLPPYIEVSTDEAGTTSTHFGEEPRDEENRKLWELMRRDGGEEGLQLEDWGELTGPLTESEKGRVFRDFGGKTPGMSGFKNSMLQPFPWWMREAHIAYINAMLKLRLIPHRLKEVLIVCIAKETGG